MAIKPKKIPRFTVQVKVVAVVDVEVEATSIDEAITTGKALKLSDVVSLNEDVTENDHSLKIVGLFSGEDWGVN